MRPASLFRAMCFGAAAVRSVAAPPVIPNDPDFAWQWGLRNTGQTVGEVAGVPGADIDAPGAWALHRGTSAVTVAIVGRGVDPHPEFAERLRTGRAFAGDLFDTSDTCPQGTHLAGIIGAAMDDGIGVAGVNGHTRLLPVRVFDGCLGTASATAAGIVWAADNGADVVLVATGFNAGDAALAAAVEYAEANDVLVIAHAGVTGDNMVVFPAAYPGCMAVSATNNRDEASSVSNHGLEVELAAPGTDIWTTGTNGGYTYVGSGLDPLAAAAFVVGAASLVRSYAPALSAADVRQILTDSADDLGEPGRDVVFGFGRLNARRALEMTPRPALRFEEVEPAPAVLPPGRASAFVVRIVGVSENVRAGLMRLRYRAEGATPFASKALVSLGDDRYLVVFPGFACDQRIEYYLSAVGDGGTLVADPPRGKLHHAVATTRVPRFTDDFETDRVWEAVGGDNTSGRWSRVIPTATSAQPGYDYSPGSGRSCFVTGQHFSGNDGTNDVDGGPVVLLSPIIALPPDEADHDVEVSYARWFYWDGVETEDFLKVELSRDAGVHWFTVETVASTGAWMEHAFRLSEFPGATGNQLRVRFSAADDPRDSLTEAAIDEFRVSVLPCPAVFGDADGNGAVDLADYSVLGGCLTGPGAIAQSGRCIPVDFDGNLTIDLRDFRSLLGAVSAP